MKSIRQLSPISQIKTISSHNADINCLLLLKDKRLASSSADNTIKIFERKLNTNYECSLTLIGHTDSVLCISQLENDNIISCAFLTIKIWSISLTSYTCEYTIEKAHNKWITKVISLSLNRIGSCSVDGTIKIWDNNPPYNVKATFQCIKDSVVSILQLKKKELLISAGRKDIIQIWNMKTYQNECVINGVSCFSRNSMVESDNDKVIIGGFSIVSILSTKTYRVEISIVDERIKMIHSLIRINNGKIVCGCHGGRLCLIGENGIVEYIKDCSQSDTVYSLINIDENMFISGSWDKSIKIWKY